MKFNPPNKKFVHLYRRFLHRLAGGTILLLTTQGRRSGRPHTVGLQYELIDGRYYVGAADGEHADWYRNLVKDRMVEVQAGAKTFKATAEVITEVDPIADFMEYRLKKHPLMMHLILHMDGLKGNPNRAALLTYAEKIRLVILTSCLPEEQAEILPQ